MATILRMPEVLANATEAVLSTWLIDEGRPFLAGETLAEIETEKALVDLPAEQDGILGRVLARSGDSVEVGAPIAVLISVGETEADIDAALGGHALATAVLTGAQASDPGVLPTDLPDGGAAIVSRTTSSPTGSTPHPGRLFASPIARRNVKDNGLDLASITGTGPGGRIVRRDVEEAIAARSSTAPPTVVIEHAPVSLPATAAVAGAPAGAPSGYTAIPHTGMRRAIARRLTESKSTVPHFYLTAECKVDELLALRKRVNDVSQVKVSVNDFVVKAVAAAFLDVPEANVTWTDTHLRRYDHVDIAVAVATDGGLLTPVVRGVDGLSLLGVSARILELVTRARLGRLRQEELEGGSFSVTNLGMYGTTAFSAILNPPQSGILAVGAAKQQAVVIDGALAVATVMRCTLSVDHRAVDGALAAQWLKAYTARIENPISILI